MARQPACGYHSQVSSDSILMSNYSNVSQVDKDSLVSKLYGCHFLKRYKAAYIQIEVPVYSYRSNDNQRY